MVDLLVHGGTVVSPSGSELLDVAVEGERIAAVGPPGSLGREAKRLLDASGKLVLPGAIDPHVHYSVSFAGAFSETQEYSFAAACGGTTTICDFVKGRIGAGADADIVVFDPNRSWTVRHEDLHMSSDYNCWDDWELRGKVETTVLRGRVVYENGGYVGSRTGGRFVERKLLPEILASPADHSLTFESARA